MPDPAKRPVISRSARASEPPDPGGSCALRRGRPFPSGSSLARHYSPLHARSRSRTGKVGLLGRSGPGSVGVRVLGGGQRRRDGGGSGGSRVGVRRRAGARHLPDVGVDLRSARCSRSGTLLGLTHSHRKLRSRAVSPPRRSTPARGITRAHSLLTDGAGGGGELCHRGRGSGRRALGLVCRTHRGDADPRRCPGRSRHTALRALGHHSGSVRRGADRGRWLRELSSVTLLSRAASSAAVARHERRGMCYTGYSRRYYE